MSRADRLVEILKEQLPGVSVSSDRDLVGMTTLCLQKERTFSFDGLADHALENPEVDVESLASVLVKEWRSGRETKVGLPEVSPPSTNRLFRWKCVLICAPSLEEAWDVVVKHSIVEGYIGKGHGTVCDWESDHREGGADKVYNDVSAREYLHAIDPDETIELWYEWGGLPLVAMTVSDEVYARMSKASVWMSASWWAEVLPAGWSHGWNDLEV